MIGPFKLLALLLMAIVSQATAQFSINFSYSSPLTSEQEAAFGGAVDTWESIIVGYQPGVLNTGLDITVDTSGPATGPTKIFPQPGGPYLTPEESRVFVSPATLSSLDQTTLELFFTREIGSALGIGTLWQANGLYTAGSGEYLGPAALAAYRDEFDPSASFVPVELFTGKSDVFWDEVDLAAGLTGITNASGQDFGNDIMTAWLGPNTSDTFISETTIASLEDLGYLVADKATVPEPDSLLLAALGGLCIVRKRRRYS